MRYKEPRITRKKKNTRKIKEEVMLLKLKANFIASRPRTERKKSIIMESKSQSRRKKKMSQENQQYKKQLDRADVDKKIIKTMPFYVSLKKK